MLEDALTQARMEVLHRELECRDTGCEGYFSVAGDAQAIKDLCIGLEDSCPLGRLFDMDVLPPSGAQLRRTDGDNRRCIVCGAPGRGCASRRVHTVPELQAATRRILESHFLEKDRRTAASLALQGLLDEVCTTPKPGLVDRANSGSHKDMDIFTFTASASALAPYLGQCVAIGQETRQLPPGGNFPAAAQSRIAGGNGDVLRHPWGEHPQGSHFHHGLVCGAVGRLWHPEQPCGNLPEILAECAQMTRTSMEADFAAMEAMKTPQTAGQRLYRDYGIRGIRGEVAQGLPSVSQVGLPALENALAAGKGRNHAAAIALLYLIGHVTDTNLPGAAWTKPKRPWTGSPGCWNTIPCRRLRKLRSWTGNLSAGISPPAAVPIFWP